ncbi:MAG: hypothetical protein KBA66_22440, partial [Leptospiraceae bacterium]|nr:hypothetical protein [Leptospiraceae bacterium]
FHTTVFKTASLDHSDTSPKVHFLCLLKQLSCQGDSDKKEHFIVNAFRAPTIKPFLVVNFLVLFIQSLLK